MVNGSAGVRLVDVDVGIGLPDVSSNHVWFGCSRGEESTSRVIVAWLIVAWRNAAHAQHTFHPHRVWMKSAQACG
ncbi:hypothetical protein XHV734_3142 [Xanthomonas hortorum pv. vitians]|nr:hypothetical protein XHV734_3142 [Xanthomonas hortorum pv. vitians]